MKSTRLLFILAAAALLSCSALLTSSAVAQDRTITVLGVGVAHGNADRVELQLSVTSQDVTATSLFVKQNDIVMRLKKALVAGGVDAASIHEQSFKLMPNYEYGQQGTRIISYRVETPLELEVTDLSSLPHLIDLATAGGASSVNIGSFVQKPGESLHDAAMRNALTDARNEAAALAKDMGKQVGDIISIAQTEDAGSAAPARSGGEEEEERREATKAAAKGATNSLSEKAEVRVVFQLK